MEISRMVKISARGMGRIKVGGRFLVENNWQDKVQGIGGGIHVFAPGQTFLRGLGFQFQGAIEPDGGTNIKGKISLDRLPEFEQWLVRTRAEGLADQRELDLRRELLEELRDESQLLPDLAPEEIVTQYLWATKPPIESQGTQRYMEVYDVILGQNGYYDQLARNIRQQCRFVLVSEAAILSDEAMRTNSKLVSLLAGQMPGLA